MCQGGTVATMDALGIAVRFVIAPIDQGTLVQAGPGFFYALVQPGRAR